MYLVIKHFLSTRSGPGRAAFHKHWQVNFTALFVLAGGFICITIVLMKRNNNRLQFLKPSIPVRSRVCTGLSCPQNHPFWGETAAQARGRGPSRLLMVEGSTPGRWVLPDGGAYEGRWAPVPVACTPISGLHWACSVRGRLLWAEEAADLSIFVWLFQPVRSRLQTGGRRPSAAHRSVLIGLCCVYVRVNQYKIVHLHGIICTKHIPLIITE